MQSFFDLVQQRRACHHFVPGFEIPREDLEKMVECAALSPSGYNAQPWDFVIIQDPENRAKVAEIAFKQEHLKDASAMVVVVADAFIGRHVDTLLEDWVEYGYCTEEEVPVYRNSIAKVRSPEKLKMMGVRSAMLAAMTLMYAAEDMGYATSPVMGFSQWQLEEHLGLPEDRSIALLIAVGKGQPEKELPRLPRKALKDLLHWEFFKEK